MTTLFKQGLLFFSKSQFDLCDTIPSLVCSEIPQLADLIFQFQCLLLLHLVVVFPQVKERVPRVPISETYCLKSLPGHRLFHIIDCVVESDP